MTSWSFENRTPKTWVYTCLFVFGWFGVVCCCLVCFGLVFWGCSVCLKWEVGWLFINLKGTWVFAVFTDPLNEKGEVVWNTVLVLLTPLKETPWLFFEAFDMSVCWAHFRRPALWDLAIWKHKDYVNYLYTNIVQHYFRPCPLAAVRVRGQTRCVNTSGWSCSGVTPPQGTLPGVGSRCHSHPAHLSFSRGASVPAWESD